MEELSPLLEARLNLIVEMGQKNLREEIAHLKEQINSLNKRIEQLKAADPINIPEKIPRNVPEMPPEHVAPPTSEVGQSIDPPLQSPSQKEESSKEKETEERHPRSGIYNSEDVSIEKFFYFGNK